MSHWPRKILDYLNKVIVVVDSAHRVAYVSDAARRALPEGALTLGEPLPWAEIAPQLLEVRSTSREVVRSGLELGGSRWRALMWPIEEDYVALALDIEQAQEISVTQVASSLGVGRSQAELALGVAQGQSNQALAHRLGVELSTVKGRLWRLYRRLGVRNRAELTATVVRAAEMRQAL